MSVYRSCKDTDKGRQRKCSEENLSQCQFAQYKSSMDWPGVEGGPVLFEVYDYPPEVWHDQR